MRQVFQIRRPPIVGKCNHPPTQGERIVRNLDPEVTQEFYKVRETKDHPWALHTVNLLYSNGWWTKPGGAPTPTNNTVRGRRGAHSSERCNSKSLSRIRSTSLSTHFALGQARPRERTTALHEVDPGTKGINLPVEATGSGSTLHIPQSAQRRSHRRVQYDGSRSMQLTHCWHPMQKSIREVRYKFQVHTLLARSGIRHQCCEVKVVFGQSMPRLVLQSYLGPFSPASKLDFLPPKQNVTLHILQNYTSVSSPSHYYFQVVGQLLAWLLAFSVFTVLDFSVWDV